MIIFLDFDGVMHSVSQQDKNPFDDICIENIYSCLKNQDVKIVITSSHRKVHSQEHLMSQLGPLGEYVVGTTPIIDERFLKHVRFEEVVLWLMAENSMDEKWIAIDDVPGNYPGNANIIITDPHRGFSETDAIKLSSWLDISD